MTRLMTLVVIVNLVVLLALALLFFAGGRLILLPLGIFILLIVNLVFLFLLVREKKMS